MERFFHSVTFKIGMIIVLAEITVLSVLGFVYINRFSATIDQQLESQIKLPAMLMNAGLLSLASLAEQDTMRQLVGEELVAGWAVDANGKIFAALTPEYRRKRLADIPGMKAEWFDFSHPRQLVELSEGNMVSISPIFRPGEETPRLFVYIKIGTAETEAEKNQIIQLFLIGSVATVIFTTLIIILSFKFTILAGITEVLTVLERVDAGDLSARTSGTISKDEIGTLHRGVNATAAQLEEVVNNLELLVQTRTAELGESQRIMQTLISNLPGIAYRTLNDRNWTLLLMSEGCLALTGYPATAFISNEIKFADLIHPDDQESTWHIVQEALRQKKSFELTYRIITKTGQLKWVWEQGQGVLDQSGKLLVLEGLINDISEQKQTEMALQQAKEAAEVANQAKSAFLANMTHELRSPLNAILGFAHVLMRGQCLDQDGRENLDIILRSGEHLLSLINQVLDLSKIEAGRMRLNPREFNVGRLVGEMEEMFRLKAEKKDLQLIFACDPGLPFAVRADELKLRQVIINLLNNALKFTERGGITVRVKSEKCQVSNDALHVEHDNPPLPTLHSSLFTLHFEISDTGPGIAPEEMGTLFEAFEQTSSGRQSQEGTGLGLPISRTFVRMMGGDLQAQSQVGKGTIFRFDIKAEVLDDAQTQALPVTSRLVTGVEPGQPHYRILIVDDKPLNRLLLVKLLQPLGFEVREANNGEEALGVCEAWAPHLIWMDVRMPVLDGYAATRKIRNLTSETRNVPIIALTANSLEEERMIALSNGCDDFLRKPFNEQAIFETMTRHLGVRFVYAEEPPLDTPDARDVDLPAALAQLPPDLPEQLRYAVTHSDVALIDRVIDDMRAYQPAAADLLTNWADNFQYEEILQVLQKGHEPV